MSDVPNPGSREALKLGCRCPVMDNNHGQWPPFPADEGRAAGWWLSTRCPVHGSWQGAEARPRWLQENPDGFSITDRD